MSYSHFVEHIPARHVAKEFQQIEWDKSVEEDCRQIVRLAVREDLDRLFDWTTLSLIPSGVTAEADIVARTDGVIAGLPAVGLALAEMDCAVEISPSLQDATSVTAGQTVATIAGPARSMLAAERIVLNLLGHLSGVATLARRYVEAVAGTKARIYDTRKTTPGWRRLEKYAVRCGGGHNHRTGLFDAILIKDNHLAVAAAGAAPLAPAEAVRRAREFARALAAEHGRPEMIVEVEVDSLEQLQAVLPAGPNLVLLDNFGLDQLRQAVAMCETLAAGIELEASGGVNLDSVAAIAATGVDRISVGALTHSAAALDVALDWR